MARRTTIIFWAVVVGIQATGTAMDFFGGNLDDPIRLMGELLLIPGYALGFQWMSRQISAHPDEYLGVLGIPVAINLAIASLIYLVMWMVAERKKRHPES